MPSAPIALLFLCAVLTGCAPRSGAPAAAPQPAGEPHVSLEKVGDTTWQATWHLAEPAAGLRFERPAAGFRRGMFEVLTPGFAFARDGEAEVLRTNGEPARTIVVRFPEAHLELQREYEPVRRFTDGSVALYTGHLVARPETGDTSDCDSCWIRRLRVVPPSHARVVIGGEVHTGAVTWTDSTGQGTYVYVGTLEPVQGPGFVAITDPGLPAWVVARWSGMLVQLFDGYTERFGLVPPSRTTVLFDYRPDGPVGHYSAGGVLPGVIQLGLTSRGWEQESPEALQRVVRFLAHEAAHVWNGSAARNASAEDPWLHEGSAEAAADRMLVALGLASEDEFLAAQTAALNTCRSGIGERAIRATARSATLPYACGNVLALISDAALRRHGADLFALWRAVIAETRVNGGAYTVATYMDAWRRLGGSDEELEQFLRLVEETAQPDSLVAALTAHGVRIVTDDTPPASHAAAQGRDALLALMQRDCNGRASFQQAEGGLRVAPTLRCGTLPAGALVRAIGGHDLSTAGHLAWAHLASRCGPTHAVPVTIADAGVAGGSRTVEISCGTPVAPRPAYVRITRALAHP